ncbi:hypothetical protein [Pantoea ananatis]|uniref:hypothetical protein n=1 Tax=Pantoea ananas TaxID=553 RepID=UPI001B30CA64|nr:hypothetical protein [Pantoea ananatis]
MIETNFRNNSSLKSLIRSKQREIEKRISGGIQESDNFKLLFSGFTSYLQKRVRSDYKVILITKNDLNIIDKDTFYENLENTLDSDDGQFSNYIQIDSKMLITTKEIELCVTETEKARRLYLELSKEAIVFVLSPNNLIKYFIDSEEFGNGIFLTMADFNAYQKMKPISEINFVFKDYRQKLKERNTYSKFFISKSHLLSLREDLDSELDEKKFVTSYSHILNNKPEDSFREDLREYLSKNLRAKLLPKEYILQNFKRLDIFILDESGFNMYFIEVKWVGTSIHSKGKMIGTSYDEVDITPAAFRQSISYIKQLSEQSNNIKLGYLVVFDARQNQALSDTGNGINCNLLDKDDRKFFSQFRKVDDFKVKNSHPN